MPKLLFLTSVWLLMLLRSGLAEDSRDPSNWFRYSRADLELAQLALNHTNHFENVCFLSHQAVEKSLKGDYYLHGQIPPKSHRISALAKELSTNQQSLERQEELLWLDSLYLVSRYPTFEKKILSEADGMKCLDIAVDFFNQINLTQPIQLEVA